tara:strand:- start:1157 stop:1840 length:684 start_codon:yes stop_codon:yes gene_type:complete
MADLHIFGDSYSVDWDIHSQKKPWTGQSKYYKWLGRTPEHFQNIIKKEFNLTTIHNYAIGGHDNYSILESIGRYIKKIQKDDFVCIGWSDISRHRMVYDNQWVKLLGGMHTVPSRFKNDVPKEFLTQCLDRMSELTKNEVLAWMNILILVLPKNTIFWSPFGMEQEYSVPWIIPNFVYPRISQECDIPDEHFGEVGHIKVGKWLVEHFKNNPYHNINENLFLGERLI